MPIRTFVDSCVLIAAAQGKAGIADLALELLDDPNREFVVSELLRLEVVPKPLYTGHDDEVEFMEEFLGKAGYHEPATQSIAETAVRLASNLDLQPMDALHVGTAIAANVEEFVTAERATSPLMKVTEVTMVTLRK